MPRLTARPGLRRWRPRWPLPRLRRPWGRAVARLVLVALPALALGAFVLDEEPAASQALSLGDENSWIRVQNVGTAPAVVDVDSFDGAGRYVATDGCPREGVCGALAPGLGRSFLQETAVGLPEGYRGSAEVASSQPFVALLARDVLREDGTLEIGGDTLAAPGSGGSGASSYVLPWVENSLGYASRIVVQNSARDAGTCVQIRYYDRGQTEPTAVDPASPSTQCPDGGQYLAPNASWVRDEISLPLRVGFEGSARVASLPVAAAPGEGRIEVTVDTRRRSGAGLASYRGIAQGETSRQVLLPLVVREHVEAASEDASAMSTRFRIATGDPSVPTDVALIYTGTGPGGEQIEVEHTVTVTGNRTCDQRASGEAACLPAGTSLPDGFSGAVRLFSAEPVAAVAQRLGADGSLGDYRGVAQEAASTQVVLPVLDKNYGGLSGGSGWNSSFRILTPDGRPARVTVVYYSDQFRDGLFPPLPQIVNGALTVRQWENPTLPDGWIGSAVIISDRPVVAVVNVESDVFEGDATMLYGGVSID